MKFYCDNCGAKYLIGDEKVRGKILRIRCKKCENVIVVKELASPVSGAHRSLTELKKKLRSTGTHKAIKPAEPLRASAKPTPSQAPRVSLGGAAAVRTPPPLPAVPPPMPWYYSVAGKSFGPMPLVMLREKFTKGQLGDEAYVWNKGMTDWIPAKECQDLSSAFERGDVRKPKSPTITLSAADIRKAHDQRNAQAQNGVQKNGAANGVVAAPGARTIITRNAPEPGPSALSSRILKRASRTRGAATGTPILSRASSEPARVPPIASPDRPKPAAESGPEGEAKDRLHALRDRLRSTGVGLDKKSSLRERLRAVAKKAEADREKSRESLKAKSEAPEKVESAAPPTLIYPTPERPAPQEEAAPETQIIASPVSEPEAPVKADPLATQELAEAPQADPLATQELTEALDTPKGAEAPHEPLPATQVVHLDSPTPEAVAEAITSAQPQAEEVIPATQIVQLEEGDSALDTKAISEDQGPLEFENAKSEDLDATVADITLADLVEVEPEPVKASSPAETPEEEAFFEAPVAPSEDEDPFSIQPTEAFEAKSADEAETELQPLDETSVDLDFGSVDQDAPASVQPGEDAATSNTSPGGSLFPTTAGASGLLSHEVPQPVEPINAPLFPPAATADVGGLRPISQSARTSLEKEDSPTNEEMSQSLLIQLSDLKKSDQKRRGMFVVAAIVVVLSLSVAGFIIHTVTKDNKSVSTQLSEQAAESKARNAAQHTRSDKVDNPKGYDKNALNKFTEIELDDVPLDLQDDPVDDPEKVAEADKAKEDDPEKKAVASKETPKGASKKATGLDAIKNSSLLKPKKGDALGDAMGSAKKQVEGDNSLRRRDTDSEGKVEKAAPVKGLGKVDNTNDKGTGEDPLEAFGALAPTRVEAPDRKKSPDDKGDTPMSLSREQLGRGFVSIRKSVFQCVEKQTRRSGDDFAAGKVKVVVTIESSGKISGVDIGSALSGTVFGLCMRSHKSRWRFPPFQGNPMKVKRSFVIQ